MSIENRQGLPRSEWSFSGGRPLLLPLLRHPIILRLDEVPLPPAAEADAGVHELDDPIAPAEHGRAGRQE